MSDPLLDVPTLGMGSTMGNFRLLDLLGEGGMGLVFLAEDLTLHRKVAFKVMQPRLARLEETRLRFLREARLAANVEHEKIVRIYQVGEAGGVPFIAMELLMGDSLDSLLRRLPIPSFAFTMEVVSQVAEGLMVAHRAGLIHRDIKPSNIWVRSGAGAKPLACKILDFGLARPIEGDSISVVDGRITGTPLYMAPEQWRGIEVDARSDLFSLGVILYQMTTGKYPFSGTSHQIMCQATLESPLPPRSLNSAIPLALEELILKLLAKEKASRVQSAGELIGQLELLRPTLPTARVPSPESPGVAERESEFPGEPMGIPSLPVLPTQVMVKNRSRFFPMMIVLIVLLLASGTLLLLKKDPKPTTVSQNEGAIIPPKEELKPLLQKPLLLDCLGKNGADEQQVQASQKEWANYLGVQVVEAIDLGGGIKMEFVLVPPGRYFMGASQKEHEEYQRILGKGEQNPDWLAWELPRHEVEISQPFFLGKFEVTQEAYTSFSGEKNPSAFSLEGKNNEEVKGIDTRKFPVESVNWFEATKYATKLEGKRLPVGFKRVRLPREAEWEYACRAGTRTTYHFGDQLSGKEANADGASPFGTAIKGEYLQRPRAVGFYPANALGIHDLHGNVSEWCEDGFEENAYEKHPKSDPFINPSTNFRVLRGGSWDSFSRNCRSASRSKDSASERFNQVGFRLVLVP